MKNSKEVRRPIKYFDADAIQTLVMTRFSQHFVRALKKGGVTHVFGIPSIHNIGLYNALREEPSIRHILCRHESSATHMADGYARSGKGVGVVITSTGPGAAYMTAAGQMTAKRMTRESEVQSKEFRRKPFITH